MNIQNIYHRVLEVYRDCAIQTFPINCIDILHHYSYKVIPYTKLPLAKAKACWQLSMDACAIDNVIFYNDQQILERIRFTLMHELGHIVLDTDSEDDADYFSSCILAPRILIHKSRCESSEDIHKRFGLSYTASNRAFADYRQWFLNLCYTTRMPSPPEKALQDIFYPEILTKHENEEDSEKQKGRLGRYQEEYEERAEFAQMLRNMHGEDHMFQRAEYNWLYGNDL